MGYLIFGKMVITIMRSPQESVQPLLNVTARSRPPTQIHPDRYDSRGMQPLPYKIAVLCYLFDEQDRVLMLHRRKPPNQHLYSPIGGKLEQAIGESPTMCAVREIHEETGLRVESNRLHLTGIVSEEGFDDRMHWLMFLYELVGPVSIDRTEFDEGTLEWHKREDLPKLAIPRTDSEVIWPLFWEHRRRFFMVHIRCANGAMDWTLEQPPRPE